MADCDRSVPKCAFSLDGATWLEGGQDYTGPLAHEPGWDFFVVSLGAKGAPAAIRVSRSFPIRLVRVYGEWPSSDSALATVLHPSGVKEAEVALPEAAMKLPKLLVAVCPPASAAPHSPPPKRVLGSGLPADRPSVNDITRFGSASAAVAAAEAEAQAAELEHHAIASCGRPRLLAYLRRQGSNSPAPSDLSTCSSARRAGTRSNTSGTPRDVTAGGILAQLYDEAVLTAFQAGEACGDEGLDALSGIRSKAAEIEALRKELDRERLARQVAEVTAEQAEGASALLREECSRLQHKLRSAERQTMALEMQGRQLNSDLERARVAGFTGVPVRTLDECVSGLVSLELAQLNGRTAEERAAVKRKLLLKWHPDKNSGNGGGNELAKQIMQALQSHPSWS